MVKHSLQGGHYTTPQVLGRNLQKRKKKKGKEKKRKGKKRKERKRKERKGKERKSGRKDMRGGGAEIAETGAVEKGARMSNTILINQSGNQLVSQLANQSINQSLNHSISQSIDREKKSDR